MEWKLKRAWLKLIIHSRMLPQTSARVKNRAICSQVIWAQKLSTAVEDYFFHISLHAFYGISSVPIIQPSQLPSVFPLSSSAVPLSDPAYGALSHSLPELTEGCQRRRWDKLGPKFGSPEQMLLFKEQKFARTLSKTYSLRCKWDITS